MDNFQIRTDLALEARESVNEEESKLRGVSVEEHYEEEADLRITKVTIDTKNAEKMLGKPMGVYVTMEAPAMVEPDDDYHREISEALAEELLKMMPQEQEEQSVLVVGLGNRSLTADAVGPLALPHILVTRHMLQAMPEEFAGFSSVAALTTGVLAETGLESFELIAAAAEKLQPRCVIVLDALAAAGREKLCAVLQITDTGLTPGSGVGNHRREVSRKTLGVPVLALGLPTVIRADQLIGEEAPAEGEALFVTPRDIDQRVRELSRMMAYGIDLALQPHLTVDDITGLLG